MIVKIFNPFQIFKDESLFDDMNRVVAENDQKLYFWNLPGTTTVGMTTTNIPKLTAKIKEVNEAIDLKEVMQLGLDVEYRTVVECEDGSGYAFRFIDDNKVYNIEPQVFISGIQFSCEHFMKLPLGKLQSLVFESRDDLVRQIRCQLTGNERLFAVSSIDQSDIWFPKVYPYECRVVSCEGGYAEKCSSAIVVWIAAINENFENVLVSDINAHSLDFTDTEVLTTYKEMKS